MEGHLPLAYLSHFVGSVWSVFFNVQPPSFFLVSSLLLLLVSSFAVAFGFILAVALVSSLLLLLVSSFLLLFSGHCPLVFGCVN